MRQNGKIVVEETSENWIRHLVNRDFFSSGFDLTVQIQLRFSDLIHLWSRILLFVCWSAHGEGKRRSHAILVPRAFSLPRPPSEEGVGGGVGGGGGGGVGKRPWEWGWSHHAGVTLESRWSHTGFTPESRWSHARVTLESRARLSISRVYFPYPAPLAGNGDEFILQAGTLIPSVTLPLKVYRASDCSVVTKSRAKAKASSRSRDQSKMTETLLGSNCRWSLLFTDCWERIVAIATRIIDHKVCCTCLMFGEAYRLFCLNEWKWCSELGSFVEGQTEESPERGERRERERERERERAHWDMLIFWRPVNHVTP